MDPIDRLFAREVEIATVSPDGFASNEPPADPVVLSGSFNPLHRGHRNLLEVAEQMAGRVGWFEISVENVDKPDLERWELTERLGQFEGYRGVILTHAPRFMEKTAAIPGAVFVVGFDTALRIIDDRYYMHLPAGRSEPRWASALRIMKGRGCSFLVAGRVDDKGRFREVNELDIPEEFESMLRAIPESEFREDVSSTELRRQGE